MVRSAEDPNRMSLAVAGSEPSSMNIEAAGSDVSSILTGRLPPANRPGVVTSKR